MLPDGDSTQLRKRQPIYFDDLPIKHGDFSYVKLQEGSRCWCDGSRVVMFQRSSELKTSKRMT